jgi:hypothetical protein
MPVALPQSVIGVDRYPTANPVSKRLIVRVKVDRLGGIDPKMWPWA